MALNLEYEDKYRLWSIVVQGAVDRVFVPTEDPPPIGAIVPVHLVLPGLETDITGTVVGRRRKGDRFPGGVYVRFSLDELDACRSFLGLAASPERYSRGRKATRVQQTLELRFREPAVATPCAARNLSETGLLAACPAALFAGQRVEVTLTLDDGVQVPLTAEVAWVKPSEELAGLHFVDLSQQLSGLLSAAIRRMLQVRAAVVPAPPTPTVVVADEDPLSEVVIARAVEKHGAQALHAKDGEEVLALTRKNRPSLVLLDILLPNVYGVDICKLMRADVELADIPVIFFSALDASRLHALADEAGATDYLTKPAEAGDLARMMGLYFHERRPA